MGSIALGIGQAVWLELIHHWKNVVEKGTS
jgi:hypothetical protein